MKIPEEILKTVGFIAYRNKITQELVPVGSVFFVGIEASPGADFSSEVYAVTARHIIDGLRRKGCTAAVLRLNSTTGGLIEADVSLDRWHVHPTDQSIDVAVAGCGLPEPFDHLVIPHTFGGDQTKMAEHEVGLGDEVFISGLFQHHFGKDRNIPIVRIGNLAALNEERVQTKTFGSIDAYLIEARSIGGLSGSPVFLNLGSSRVIKGRHVISGSGIRFFLLGLIHGHYDVSVPLAHDTDEENGISTDAVNSGIAVVVPFSSIMEVIKTVPKVGDAPD